jgi:hypothetical protein
MTTMSLNKLNEITITCPQCKGKFAHIINFGKKGHCWNCRYVWELKYKGGKTLSTQMRLENV